MGGTVRIKNFSKSYGTIRAVEDLTLNVKSGELFGLIGPDGAGKTSTMRTICTLLPLEHGQILVDEKDVKTQIPYIRSVLGYMPQRFSLYPDLTVDQNLEFFANLFQISKAEKSKRLPQLYQFSKLEPFKGRLASALSGGMKQKLALSCTLIHTPKILVLDEPTTGVDPVSRREFWQILQQLRDEGVTILVSTSYMDEATLCDRVAFLHKGRLLAFDKPENIHKLFPYQLYEIIGDENRRLEDYFRSDRDTVAVNTFGDCLHVSYKQQLDENEISQLKRQAPSPIQEFRTIIPTMEDTFLALMKEQGMANE